MIPVGPHAGQALLRNGPAVADAGKAVIAIHGRGLVQPTSSASPALSISPMWPGWRQKLRATPGIPIAF